MIKERLRRLFGKANTSSPPESSKRCPACSGHSGPMANKHSSISGLWTISVCDLRISWILVGTNSSIRMTLRKLQAPSLTRFRPERPTRLCTVYVEPTASIVGIMPVVSLYAIGRGASSSGTAGCDLKVMRSTLSIRRDRWRLSRWRRRTSATRSFWQYSREAPDSPRSIRVDSQRRRELGGKSQGGGRGRRADPRGDAAFGAGRAMQGWAERQVGTMPPSV